MIESCCATSVENFSLYWQFGEFKMNSFVAGVCCLFVCLFLININVPRNITERAKKIFLLCFLFSSFAGVFKLSL